MNASILLRWLPWACALAFVLVPLEATAKLKICWYWHTETRDENVFIEYMEDDSMDIEDPQYWPDDHRGRGVFYEIDPPPTDVPDVGYLSQSDGCITFSPEPGHTALWFITGTEQKLGQATDITLGAFANQDAYDRWLLGGGTQPMFSWLTYVPYDPLLCDSPAITCFVRLKPTAFHELSNLMGIGAWVVYHLDQQIDPPIATGEETIAIIGDDCPSSSGASCTSSDPVNDLVYIQETGCQPPVPPTAACGSRYKFLIGHELGHWVQQYWRGASLGAVNYSPGGFPSDPPYYGDVCWSGSGGDYTAHMLYSVEQDNAAFGEGFAHFLSTVAFNYSEFSWGYELFDYYKSLGPGSPVYDYPYEWLLDRPYTVNPGIPGSIDPGGILCNHCNNGGPAGNWGVEHDWLGFYWAYAGEPIVGERPTLAQLLDQIDDAGAAPDGQAYEKLSAVPPVGYEQEWTVLSEQFGLNRLECP